MTTPIGGPPQPPVLAVHDTWLSVDPITGCPANCAYCFLGPMGLRAQRPIERASAAEVITLLRHEAELGSALTPVCVGNYTDMFMNEQSVDYLVGLARAFAIAFPGRMLCVVTKANLDGDDLARLADASGGACIIFCSQSFAREVDRRIERGPVSSVDDTLRNLELIARTPGLSGVHFWRPFLNELNPIETLAPRVSALASSGCTSSVVVGLKLDGPVDELQPEMRGLLEAADRRTVAADEILPLDRLQQLYAVADAGAYAVYRNTSCAIALVQRAPDGLGTHRGPTRDERCLATTCPLMQRGICFGSPQPHDADLLSLARRAAPEVPAAAITAEHGVVRIDADLVESTYNRVVQAVEGPVTAAAVHRQKAWLGSLSGLNRGHLDG